MGWLEQRGRVCVCVFVYVCVHVYMHVRVCWGHEGGSWVVRWELILEK